MIHLSRLPLDPMSRRVQNELANPYEMHRTLCHAFPGLTDQEFRAARVLFRADDDHNRLSLLVQSQRAPDWSAFASRLQSTRYLRGEPQATSWLSVEEQLEAGEFRLKEGQTLRFRLQANPVYAPKENGAKNGTRRGLFREAERLDWLRRQGEQHGFALPMSETTLRRTDDKPVVFRGRECDELTLDLPVCEMIDLNDGRRFALPAQKNQFSAALFEGHLTVTEAKSFACAVENGIGKAKGFGFGLLSVAPANK